MSDYLTVEFINTRYGSYFLHIDQFLYTKKSGDDKKTYWVCRRRNSCSAKARTRHVRGTIVVLQGPNESEHSHAPDPDEVDAERLWYDPKIWNQYNAVLNRFQRTNNLSEGWHNRFHKIVGRNHPSLYAFFKELQKEQAATETMISQLDLGQPIRAKKSRVRIQNEERIYNIVNTYQDLDLRNKDEVLKYLRHLGHYINM